MAQYDLMLMSCGESVRTPLQTFRIHEVANAPHEHQEALQGGTRQHLGREVGLGRRKSMPVTHLCGRFWFRTLGLEQIHICSLGCHGWSMRVFLLICECSQARAPPCTQ